MTAFSTPERKLFDVVGLVLELALASAFSLRPEVSARSAQNELELRRLQRDYAGLHLDNPFQGNSRSKAKTRHGVVGVRR